jgi:uncharacterized protein (TIGR02246 family)
MRTKVWLGVLGGLLAGLAIGGLIARHNPAAMAELPRPTTAPDEPKADKAPPKEAADDADTKAERDALRKVSQDFVRAFDKGDARAVAAFWTEKGEYYDDTGAELHGRAAIEKNYAELFKANPKMKLEIDIRSIHFPSHDSAVEDGVLWVKAAGAELPTSSRYSAFHVREDGTWKVASVREWGAAEDKLEDLAWLIGSWEARTKDRDAQVSFSWNETKSLIRCRFSAKENGKVSASGTQTIGIDPQTGELHSWQLNEDGGRGEIVWSRDGNRWILEASGVTPDGTETSSHNILTRINENEFLWRSVDRTIGRDSVPDTAPIKLTRVKADR